MALKERMERFIFLPFSIGCASPTSVNVVENQPKNARIEQGLIPQGYSLETQEERSHESVRTKSSSLFLQLPKPNFSAGIQKLTKGFKNLSNIFSIYKDEDEEEEAEMEIGHPTDVRHVTHIGWDGLNNVGGVKKSWEKAPEFFPLSSLSLKQFELAMASQAEGSGPI